MKIFQLIQLSFKYLCRNLRRYFFLLLAIGFGFSIVTLITSLKDGMADSVYYSAQSHYAGDIMIAGYRNDTRSQQRITETEKVIQAIHNANIDPVRIVQRTIFGMPGALFFNGISVMQKYIIGLDWENETDYFASLNWVVPMEGSLGKNDIIISEPVARELNARTGDQLILEMETITGQKNTGVFIVKAIVRDSTIFGYYKCYLLRHVLNELVQFSPQECSIFGIYLRDRSLTEKAKLSLQREMEKLVQTSSLANDRKEFRENRRGQKWPGIRHFVLTLDVMISEISDLLRAMNILTYFLYTMMLLIILVSASVTYGLILRERTREIGTMRALGFQETDVQVILLFEVFFLCVFAIIAGYFLAILFAWVVSFLPFSWMPSFEIFMKNGRLQAEFLPKTQFLNISLVLCILLPAVWFPAFSMSRNPLPEMIAGGGRT